ncbi:MAG: DegV family EDD domain-containing protein [Candidatus Riflebacteria bacterium]|nr:DegV family EDD domain-containing protein [Candidatus Riflebacteria bacterium]
MSLVALSKQYGPVRRIDGTWFARLMIAGTRWVCAHRQELNRINVFPVVDGDTGTNMAATLRSVAAALRDHHRPLPELGRAAADGCLMGARGNSGMILCHIFSSMAAGIGQRQELEPVELLQIFQTASAELYTALERPVEGTILTVLRESSTAPSLDECCDLEELLIALCRESRRSLDRTPELLEVLKKAQVVDAGALGYVYFLEGMLREVQGLPVPELGDEVASGAPRAKTHKESPAFRYCTEVIIESRSPLTTGRLKTLFKPHGDSLIPLLTGRLAKIHIHTNDPQAVFVTAGQVGRVVKTKVEDMRNQNHGMFSDDPSGSPQVGPVRTHIVADSTCDLPSEVLAQWGIQLVPLKVMFGDETLRDRVDILPDEYIHRLTTSSVHPSTSQPAPEDFSKVFRGLLPDMTPGHEVLVMVISKSLSGTFNSCKLAIDRHEPGRIHLFDASFASAPFGLLVLRAAELARQGLSAREIVERLESMKSQTNILFVLDTLEYMKRGGRIGWGQAFLGGLLDLKPILEFKEGRMVPRAKVRGRDGARAKVLEFLDHELPKDRPVRFLLVHSGRPDLLAPVEEHLTKTFKVSSLMSCTAGAVISTHTGPGAWGIAWMIE